MSKQKIISVTGTKGKTTVVYLIDEILRQLGKITLRVDTTGHYVNGIQKSTLEDSKQIWGLVPTVCPGRYLYEFYNGELKSVEDGIAVLEAALGSSALPGIGYKRHQVGIFTNVFEDHLGSTERLKTREDIAVAKAFIFEKLDLTENSYAVFNADDELVVNKLYEKIINTEKKELKQVILPCGEHFSHFNLETHLASGGAAFVIRDKKLILAKNNEETIIADYYNIPWTFDGEYNPSMLNIMYAVAGVYSLLEGDLPENIKEVVEGIRLDPYGGRLTVLKAENGAMIIADYAHEKVSLKNIGDLATSLAENRKGKTIGIVRLAYDRTDESIRETGHVIAESFDELVVYDKIDGYWRQPKDLPGRKFQQVIGKTSATLTEAIKEKNSKVTRIIREDEAIEFAAANSQGNDVIVIIINDDIKQSIGFIKEKFTAEFI